MSTQTLIFLILAAITAVSAIRVVTTGLITHAALFLALGFTSVAGIFLQLNADFLAAAQVLIYVGAITTMIIFAIMLSDIREIKAFEGKSTWERFKKQWLSRQWGVWPVLVGIVFSAVMFWLYAQSAFQVSKDAPPDATTSLIGQQLFSTYALPFEVASLVLLVAMIGAIILTAKEVK